MFFEENNIKDKSLYYDLSLSQFVWSEDIFHLMLIENEKKAINFINYLTSNNSIKSSIYFWAVYLRGSLKFINRPIVIVKIYYFFTRSIFKSILLKNFYSSLFNFTINIPTLYKKIKIKKK